MSLWPWTERTFQFDFPVGKMPDLMERLRGTPARIEERIRGISQDVLKRRPPTGGWSIQENIGHLLDLGYLPRRRIEQILAGETNLIAADMGNRKTHEAGHNDRDAQELLSDFRTERMALVAQVEAIDPSEWGRSGMHPRLGQPMRLVDVVFFDSEHDDYHLARIGALIRLFA